jgi:hypothetical protein
VTTAAVPVGSQQTVSSLLRCNHPSVLIVSLRGVASKLRSEKVNVCSAEQASFLPTHAAPLHAEG